MKAFKFISYKVYVKWLMKIILATKVTERKQFEFSVLYIVFMAVFALNLMLFNNLYRTHVI